MRWQAVWWVVGSGLLLGSCGGTSNKQPGQAGSTCLDDCPDSCEPGRKFCHERQVWACDKTGEDATLVESCALEQECTETDGAAQCQGACPAATPTCDGDVATLCEGDGSGPEPGGEDCSEAGQVCEQGQCVDAACVPGEKQCRNDDVMACGATGKSLTLVDDCKVEEACDPELSLCRPRLCEGGALACDQSRVKECNAAGTGWIATEVDCASQNETCFEGACQEPTCTAAAQLCQDNAVHVCEANGVSLTLVETCQTNYHCQESGVGFAACYVNQCVAGQPVCDGNILKTCSDDGTFPAKGDDCGDEVCQGATCKPVVCDIDESLCKDGNVYGCPEPGVVTSLLRTCPVDTSCGSLEGGVECLARPCTANATACLGNAIGTCAANGQSLGGAAVLNCAGANKVCNAKFECAASAVDTLGLAEEVELVGGGEVAGNVLEVHSNRRLTKLEMNLLLEAPRDLRWVVYEWTGAAFTARVSDITANQNGSGFFSSGVLDYELVAGKRYLLGVSLVVGEGYVYYDGLPWDRELSFANALNSNRYPHDATIGPNYVGTLYRMRLTTELP